MTTNPLLCSLRDRKGATLIFVALAMIVLLGMAALAVDVGYLFVVRGELQNAADSGALAGAQALYNNNGTAINTGANQIATDYVANNYSEQATVQVQSVDRGHWSFATHHFTIDNDTVTPVDLWNVSTADLDANVKFINAVQVITTRKTVAGQPEQPFFARIFGATGRVITATAVAYIGFAGTIEPLQLDEPIAICKQAIASGGIYSCNIGRMLTNGTDTAAWTDFSQPCQGAASSSVVNGKVCRAANPLLMLGSVIGTTNGVNQDVLTALQNCWLSQASVYSGGSTTPNLPWKLTLPVIDCQNSISTCTSVLVGAVTVDVVWITGAGSDPHYENVPTSMSNPNTGAQYACNPATVGGAQCWANFVSTFGLQGADGSPAAYQAKTMYYLPDCTPHDLTGTTGGQNFGMLAKIPVLVK
jgi:Flp pilus assembly protein TadG